MKPFGKRLRQRAAAALLGLGMLLTAGCGKTRVIERPKSDPDILLSQMTLREKVGQVFVIRPDQLLTSVPAADAHDANADGVTGVNREMYQMLRDYPAGGFAIFGKNIAYPRQVRELTGALRTCCPYAPMIAVDEEGGQVARLANAYGFSLPKVGSMEKIGRTGDTEKARQAGETIGGYLADYGFTMDFAPDADVNLNPDNQVIGSRSFGSDPQLVAEMVSAYIDGLHEHGVLAVIKHFPGHGDTSEDTHSGYVALHKTWDELLAAELVPFRANLDKTDAVMVSHITLDRVTDDGLPASLSKQLVTGRLREELGYDGLVITDSLAMGAIEQHYSSEEAAVLAFDAGCDILLMPQDYRQAFDGLVKAVEDGRISEERLNESVRRILRVKYADRRA